jgi:hypothetical protein
MASKCILVAMGHGQIMDIGRGYAWSSVRVLVTSSWSSVLNMPQWGGGGRNQFRDEKELSKMQCRAARRRHKKMCFKVRRRHIFVDICSFRLEGGCSSSISGQ